MNENQQIPNLEPPANINPSSTEPAPPQVSENSVAKRSRLAFLSRPKVIVISLIAVVALVSLGLYARQQSVNNSKSEIAAKTSKQTMSKANDNKTTPQDAATLSQQKAKTPSGTTPTKTTKPSSPTATPAPVPAPAPAPAANTTNCLAPNPSPYATYYISMTNSQYLQTNSYVTTTKFYAALQFAGLLDTINSKQYVVLAMDDSGWNKFTQAQLNWMNASPANMKSVIGWQVITSCITWDGINPVKNMTIGATRTVNTLNGAVTYTHNTGGLGAFGNGKVGIWDWFTSNGSVTVAGFVNTASIP